MEGIAEGCVPSEADVRLSTLVRYYCFNCTQYKTHRIEYANSKTKAFKLKKLAY